MVCYSIMYSRLIATKCLLLIKLNVFPLILTSLFLCFALEVSFSKLDPFPAFLLPKSYESHHFVFLLKACFS